MNLCRLSFSLISFSRSCCSRAFLACTLTSMACIPRSVIRSAASTDPLAWLNTLSFPCNSASRKPNCHSFDSISFLISRRRLRRSLRAFSSSSSSIESAERRSDAVGFLFSASKAASAAAASPESLISCSITRMLCRRVMIGDIRLSRFTLHCAPRTLLSSRSAASCSSSLRISDCGVGAGAGRGVCVPEFLCGLARVRPIEGKI